MSLDYVIPGPSFSQFLLFFDPPVSLSLQDLLAISLYLPLSHSTRENIHSKVYFFSVNNCNYKIYLLSTFLPCHMAFQDCTIVDPRECGIVRNDVTRFPVRPPKQPMFLIRLNRVRNFRGRVSNFNQSEARKQSVLASDWLKFVTLPRKYPTL